jgi:hypothetical protein
MTTREKIPHTARFLMAFHTAGGTRTAPTAPAAQEVTVSDPFATATEAAAPIVDLRSPRQRELMDSLIAQLGELDHEVSLAALNYTDKMTTAGKWTPGWEGNASAWISRMIAKVEELKNAKRAAQAARAEDGQRPEPTTQPVELEDGMYLLDGQVIKVVHAIHGSGRQYGKRLVAPEAPGENGSWERVPGIVNRLTPAHKMDLVKAMELGEVYGCCVRCAKGLTKESSIRQQMGDTCASKF